MSYTGLMQSRCTIQRLSGNVPDERGLVKPVWTDLGADVKCSLLPLSSRESLRAQGWQLEVEAKLLLPAAAEVRPHPPDRILVDGASYLVLRVEGGRGKTLVAWVRRQD